MNLFRQLLRISIGLVWLLVNANVLPLGIATPKISTDQVHSDESAGSWSSIDGDPPPQGGGPRNPCDGQIAALVPITQSGDKKYYIGYTAQPLPTFRFDIPYRPESIKSSRFFLRYRGGRIDYETALKIIAPGIIQISLLASKIRELTVGQWYQAELQLKASCSDGKPSQSISSSLWVKRKLSTPIGSNLTPQQQIAFYRKENMWFEALDVAVKLERKKPSNLDWQELLSSAGLKEIASQPILDCCSPQQPQPQPR